MKIENLIGDYQTFFSDILSGVKKSGINITDKVLSHLTLRVETQTEYTYLRDEILNVCREFVETQFNGRAVSILILKKPLILEDDYRVEMIELAAPRSVHMYPTGLESLGFMIGKDLPAFIKKHRDVLTGIKDHGIHCKPAFLTFENEKTAKFYDISLREIVQLQGWKIAHLKLG